MRHIRLIFKRLSVMPVLLWTLLIFGFSSQSYQEQSIQPFLQNHFSQEAMRKAIPDITVRYHHAVIEARNEPFRFVEFLFRKAAHLFTYAMLGAFAYAALLSYDWKRLYKLFAAEGYTVLIASLDEWNQSMSAQRTSAIQDVAMDAVGGCIGLLLAILAAGILYHIGKYKFAKA